MNGKSERAWACFVGRGDLLESVSTPRVLCKFHATRKERPVVKLRDERENEQKILYVA